MKTIHLCLSVKWILDMSPKKMVKELTGLCTDGNGKYYTPIQLYNIAVECKEKGYKVIPPCDNHDDRGYCLGHEMTEESK